MRLPDGLDAARRDAALELDDDIHQTGAEAAFAAGYREFDRLLPGEAGDQDAAETGHVAAAALAKDSAVDLDLGCLLDRLVDARHRKRQLDLSVAVHDRGRRAHVEWRRTRVAVTGERRCHRKRADANQTHQDGT